MANTSDNPGQGAMSVREAGQRGGQARKQQLGSEGYSALGKKGGEATAASHGREFYQEIGQKGGRKGGQRGRQLVEGQQKQAQP